MKFTETEQKKDRKIKAKFQFYFIMPLDLLHISYDSLIIHAF